MENNLWGFLQKVPIAIYEIDYSNGKFTKVNDVMCRLSGYSREELLSTNAMDLLTPESKARFFERTKKAQAGEKIEESVEYEAIVKGGRILSVVLSVHPIKENGKFVRALVAGYDVTERKKAEEARRASEDRFSKAFHSSPIAMAISNEGGTFVDVNRSFLQLVGFTKDEVIGRSANDLGLYPELTGREMILKKLEETGQLLHYEMKARRKTGDFVTVLFSLEKIILDGRPHFLGAGVDITERKLMEQKVETYSKNLEKIVEERTNQLKDKERLAAIGQTAGMIGHDIRNPLQAITGDVYLLKDYLRTMPEVPLKRDVVESLESIGQNVSYINKIVADLQDYSRAITPQYADCNLYELVVRSFQSIIIPQEVSPSIDIDQKLRLETDPDLFQRIITNLVINALQAMPKGGELRLHAWAIDGKVSISVEDTGVGIPEAVKKKLFTPMMTTKAKGQGLGLAVVKRLVEALNGTINFESEEGKGTKFTITLPLKV